MTLITSIDFCSWKLPINIQPIFFPLGWFNVNQWLSNQANRSNLLRNEKEEISVHVWLFYKISKKKVNKLRMIGQTIGSSWILSIESPLHIVLSILLSFFPLPSRKWYIMWCYLAANQNDFTVNNYISPIFFFFLKHFLSANHKFGMNFFTLTNAHNVYCTCTLYTPHHPWWYSLSSIQANNLRFIHSLLLCEHEWISSLWNSPCTWYIRNTETFTVWKLKISV